MLLEKGLRSAGTQLFMRLQKEQQIDNKQKLNHNLAENDFETIKPYYDHQKMFDCTFCKQ